MSTERRYRYPAEEIWQVSEELWQVAETRHLPFVQQPESSPADSNRQKRA